MWSAASACWAAKLSGTHGCCRRDTAVSCPGAPRRRSSAARPGYRSRCDGMGSPGKRQIDLIRSRDLLMNITHKIIHSISYKDICITSSDQLEGQIDGLVQERRNSIANALELRLSCTNPSQCITSWNHEISYKETNRSHEWIRSFARINISHEEWILLQRQICHMRW